jgi:hypothetical protein
MTDVQSFIEAIQRCECIIRWSEINEDAEYLYCKFMSMDDPLKACREFLWKIEANYYTKSNAAQKLKIIKAAKTDEDYKVALVKCKLLDEFNPKGKVPYYRYN